MKKACGLSDCDANRNLIANRTWRKSWLSLKDHFEGSGESVHPENSQSSSRENNRCVMIKVRHWLELFWRVVAERNGSKLKIRRAYKQQKNYLVILFVSFFRLNDLKM
jgi:hypothetical protein